MNLPPFAVSSNVGKVNKLELKFKVDQRTVDADLFVAADMFELSRLRSICEAILKSRIDEENASDLLLLAYLQVSTL